MMARTGRVICENMPMKMMKLAAFSEPFMTSTPPNTSTMPTAVMPRNSLMGEANC